MLRKVSWSLFQADFSTELFSKGGVFFVTINHHATHHDLPRIHHVITTQKPRFCTMILQNTPKNTVKAYEEILPAN
jgi:hypothetical protein